MGAVEFAALMDGLVAESRASRDRAFNALDAVNRESARNADRICAEVIKFVDEHGVGTARPSVAVPAPAPERDTRFDPEEEWDRQPAPAPSSSVSSSSARPAAAGLRDDALDDDDDDDGPTWLR